MNNPYWEIDYYCDRTVRERLAPAVLWMQERVQKYWPDAHRPYNIGPAWLQAESGPDHVLDNPWIHDILPCAWVTPSGRWIGVEYGGHGEALDDLVRHDATHSEAESRGWIHAGGVSYTDCPRHDGKRHTRAQIRTLERFGYTPRELL